MEDTKNTAKIVKNQKIYSANELCNIIKVSRKYGVTNLKISGIEVSFMDQGTDSPQAGMSWTPQKPSTTYKSNKKGDATPLKPLELNDQDLAELEELERTQQAIDDPVGYEEGIIREFMRGEADEQANGYS